jgi:hypothetical protein
MLKEVWTQLDTVVSERNGVAHGRLTPDQVGRNYSIADLRELVARWEQRWGEFIDNVESKAASREFFRLPR